METLATKRKYLLLGALCCIFISECIVCSKTEQSDDDEKDSDPNLGPTKGVKHTKAQYFERSFVDRSTIETKNKAMLMRDFGISKSQEENEDDFDTTIERIMGSSENKEAEVDESDEIDPEEEAKSEAEKIFLEAISLLNKVDDKRAARKAYALFQQAWKLNHTEAGGIVAMAHVFGIHFKQNLKYARELFTNLSAVGEPRAQAGLGLMHSLGIGGFNRSMSKSLVYYTFGALGENPLAMMAMAYKNWQGIGVTQSCEGALVWYRKVADRVAEDVTMGSPVVTRVRLQDQFENPNFFSSLFDQDLIQYFQFIADKGDTKAQIGLGQLHYQGGRGVNVDYKTAYNYFQHAADKSNNANAQAYLGRMFMEDNSYSKKNYDLAFKYFKDAADQNNAMGQAGLGQMYLNGYGLKKNYAEAFKLFKLAADSGNVEGQLNLGVMYFRGLGLVKDMKKAIKYFNLASQSGHTLAFYYLAQMQESGLGMMRSCHVAVELYKNVAERGKWSEMFMTAHEAYMAGGNRRDEAFMIYAALAEMGYEVAISNMAFMLEHKEASIIPSSPATTPPTDTTFTSSLPSSPLSSSSEGDRGSSYLNRMALTYWERSAAQGYTPARVKVGDYHYYGLGTSSNYEEAVSHYRQASDQFQNAQAMFNLAYMHELGQGLKQDIHLAKRYYDMAAETSNDAYLPVLLALIKLAFLYGLEPFYNENTKDHYQMYLSPDHWLGSGWDLYAMALCGAISGALTLLIFERMRRARAMAEAAARR